MEQSCIHHWRQAPNDLNAPFTCLRCGAERWMMTNFFDLMAAKLARDATEPRREAAGRQQVALDVSPMLDGPLGQAA